jgi:hypothetical protein
VIRNREPGKNCHRSDEETRGRFHTD